MSKPKKSGKFKYQLATVLKVREIRETQQKEVYNKAIKKHEDEQKKEEEIKEFQSEKYSEFKQLIGPGTTIDFVQVQMRKGHLEVVKKQVEEQVQETKKAEDKKEEERKNLVTAVQDRRIMEIDREKTKIAWRLLMKKEADKFMDEISSIGFVKKRRAQEK
ncbi:hypothetical protein HOG98_07350 [bacterium]|jgi:flagellar export protein FliJ|nr:hypothetical protein [bacterium]